MIATLLPGWSLTPEDLATHPLIHLCEDAKQTGCIISYNTMAKGRQSVAPTLKKGALAVNPLSWTTDGAFIPATKNLGAVFFDNTDTPTTYPHFTSAQIVDGGVIVIPENIDLVTTSNKGFPKSVYHPFDYSLFYENIKVNITERINAFKGE
ncbi:MAG: hypothetical protein AUJ48_04010 [Deltaproteobacteria bacterium CG1_02_45_11]|nr:MAG: hypothetical protein AUJ48_04010 [Deltaproteobacteria bacterium CG1_02_45_11]